MADLSSPETFADTGSNASVNAARLNNHVNGATIQPVFISGKASQAPLSGDTIVYFQASSGSLVKTTIGALTALAAPASDPATGVAGSRTLGTGAQQAAPGNDTRFPSSVTGIRKGAGVGSNDTAAKPPDYALAATVGTLAAGVVTLDCSLNNNFTVTMDANGVITLSSIADGDTVCVQITQDATGSRTVAFTTTQTKIYPNSTPPTPSTAANSIDLWVFKRFGSKILCNMIPSFG